MDKIKILCIFFLLIKISYSQKYFKIYQEGIKFLKEKDTNNAIKKLEESINDTPNYLALNSLADIYLLKKDTSKSYNYYKKSFDIDTNFIASYRLGEINFYNYKDFEKSEYFFKKFLDFTPKNSSVYHSVLKKYKNSIFAKEAVKNPVKFFPRSTGNKMNTLLNEYAPSISSNQKMIIYTRLDVNEKNEKIENLYYSIFKDNQWQEGKPLPGKINTKFNEGAPFISANNKFLFFTGCNRPDGKGSCDIYFSVFTENGWGIPHNIGAPINTKYWESNPSLSSDGKFLYFSSNRPGGKGKKDIWYSEFKHGKWKEPKNLSIINTEENEESPFIHLDNSTLYFSSDGWDGMGDLDFFVTRKDSLMNWSLPENLGYPINTIYENYSLTVAADGRTAFFSSISENKTDLDIFYFELPENKRAKTTGYIKGYITNEDGRVLDKAKMSIYDIYSGKEVESFELDEGEYFGTLEKNKTYAFQVIEKDYMIYSQNLEIKDSLDVEFDIKLKKIKVQERATLNNILFEYDKYTLKKESIVELQKVLEFLTINPNIYVEFGGHTDNIGTEAYNRKLSVQRAKSVHDFILNNGISKKRISYKGYGFSKPLNKNQTQNEQQLNRRTEIKIIKTN